MKNRSPRTVKEVCFILIKNFIFFPKIESRLTGFKLFVELYVAYFYESINI